MTLFYVPNLISGSVLPEEESLHAIKVLRLSVGDKIGVVDGKGSYHIAKITVPHHKHCGFEIVETQHDYGKRNYKLHIAIAPTKNIERLEWFIEKATEIGIDEITPIVCRYSERKSIKEERFEKIIVSASKQSVKAFFPKLNPLCTFEEFLVKYDASQKFIAHCYTSPQPSPEEMETTKNELIIINQQSIFNRKLLKDEISKSANILILIGPEGDFSLEEVEKAISMNYLPISLGESRLRTETAGVVACTTVAIVNQ